MWESCGADWVGDMVFLAFLAPLTADHSVTGNSLYLLVPQTRYLVVLLGERAVTGASWGW